MPTAVAEREVHRRRGWLRRVDPELPLRLPLERLAPETGQSLGSMLEADNANGFTAAGLDLERPDHFALGLETGPGGTVALESVDARAAAETAARRPTRRNARTKRGSHTRRKQERTELSLAERLLLVLQPPLEALLEPGGLLEWPGPLYPYQYDGVQALVESDALLLADDMGLGKTIQAIAAIRVLVHLRRAEQVLIVVPASLVTQWRREFETWAPELRVTVVRGAPHDRLRMWRSRAHVFVTGYETLLRDFDPIYDSGPHKVTWDVVILDEAQRIKNRQTQTSQICKDLYRRRAWALTGTPLENRVEELASIVQFVNPFIEGDQPAPLLWDAQLFARHKEVQLRRKKADVLQDLPSKSVNDVWLQLLGEQRGSYERAERDGVVHLRSLGEEVTISHVLALIQRLKQICNVCPSSGESAKLEDMSDRLEELAAEGQRALVFSQYTNQEYGVHGIVERLAEFNPLAYDGSMSARQKDEVITLFKQDPRHEALVLSLKAGGQGLNLQEASYVFHFDRWWNPAVERQAEDRTHRLGQKNAVTVYRYICEGTIEERIDRILREKQQLFDELVDNVTIDPGALLGQKEIFGLFGLEPPKRPSPKAEEVLA